MHQNLRSNESRGKTHRMPWPKWLGRGAITCAVTLSVASCGSSGEALRPDAAPVAIHGRVVAAAPTLAGGTEASVASITVSASQDGVVVDSTQTSTDGEFQLVVVPGRVTLRFVAQGVDVSVTVTVPEGESFSITVALTPDVAEVSDAVLTRDSLRCTSGALSLDLGGAMGLVVDGGGEACVRTDGNCELDVRAREIALADCGRCVDARGTSAVHLVTTDGDLGCTASGNGIDANGTPSVDLTSAGALVIVAGGGHGIAAAGHAHVSVASPEVCVVRGGSGPIDTQGNASVVTDGCASLDLGTGDRLAPVARLVRVRGV